MTDRLPRDLRRRERDRAVSIWLDSAEPDPHEAAVLQRWRDNVPGRRQCGQCPKKATAACGCCCGEHEPRAISARLDERYDPSPEPIERRI